MMSIKKPAVIVCPGGGYTAVSHNEGEPVALAFAANGYHAFVLKYSVKIENPFPKALLELAAAVSLVRTYSEEWNILSDSVIICGFSAGGHLAASLGMFFKEKFVNEPINSNPEAITPNALILGYPALSLKPVSENREIPQDLLEKMENGDMMDFRGPNIQQILTGKLDFTQEDLHKVNLLQHTHKNMPPAFVFGTFTDPIIPVTDLTDFAALYKENNVPCELHLYSKGLHGQGLYLSHCTDIGLLQKQHMETWFNLALSWLAEL
jgi:acetyl esterase/lipase